MSEKMDENIKKAFVKVKEDISFLSSELINIKTTINELNLNINNLKNSLENTTKTEIPTIQHMNPTDSANPTHNPTDNLPLKALKNQDLGISIGNDGDPTDRQTDRQTDNSTHFTKNFLSKNSDFLQKNTQNYAKNNKNQLNIINIIKNKENDRNSLELDIKEAEEILNSLDTIKKEIRLKFKHLTNQEMLVFSLIYQLEENNEEITYKSLSKILKLSESSVRDYIQRIINKGIPIKKHKINNKNILLYISPELKKIASLSTIIKLREI